jgi:hypothetical protein
LSFVSTISGLVVAEKVDGLRLGPVSVVTPLEILDSLSKESFECCRGLGGGSGIEGSDVLAVPTRRIMDTRCEARF